MKGGLGRTVSRLPPRRVGCGREHEAAEEPHSGLITCAPAAAMDRSHARFSEVNAINARFPKVPNKCETPRLSRPPLHNSQEEEERPQQGDGDDPAGLTPCRSNQRSVHPGQHAVSERGRLKPAGFGDTQTRGKIPAPTTFRLSSSREAATSEPVSSSLDRRGNATTRRGGCTKRENPVGAPGTGHNGWGPVACVSPPLHR